jgi:hypothetical protein
MNVPLGAFFLSLVIGNRAPQTQSALRRKTHYSLTCLETIFNRGATVTPALALDGTADDDDFPDLTLQRPRDISPYEQRYKKQESMYSSLGSRASSTYESPNEATQPFVKLKMNHVCICNEPADDPNYMITCSNENCLVGSWHLRCIKAHSDTTWRTCDDYHDPTGKFLCSKCQDVLNRSSSCICGKPADVGMMFCKNVNCFVGSWHMKCINTNDLDKSPDGFLCRLCRQIREVPTTSDVCICNKPASNNMVTCSNEECLVGSWHMECIDAHAVRVADLFDSAGKFTCSKCRDVRDGYHLCICGGSSDSDMVFCSNLDCPIGSWHTWCIKDRDILESPGRPDQFLCRLCRRARKVPRTSRVCICNKPATDHMVACRDTRCSIGIYHHECIDIPLFQLNGALCMACLDGQGPRSPTPSSIDEDVNAGGVTLSTTVPTENEPSSPPQFSRDDPLDESLEAGNDSLEQEWDQYIQWAENAGLGESEEVVGPALPGQHAGFVAINQPMHEDPDSIQDFQLDGSSFSCMAKTELDSGADDATLPRPRLEVQMDRGKAAELPPVGSSKMTFTDLAPFILTRPRTYVRVINGLNDKEKAYLEHWKRACPTSRLMAQLPKERQYETTYNQPGPTPLFLDAEERQVIYDLGCSLKYSLNEYLSKANAEEAGEKVGGPRYLSKKPMRIHVPKKAKRVRMPKKAKKMHLLSEQLKKMKLSPIPEEDSDWMSQLMR